MSAGSPSRNSTCPLVEADVRRAAGEQLQLLGVQPGEERDARRAAASSVAHRSTSPSVARIAATSSVMSIADRAPGDAAAAADAAGRAELVVPGAELVGHPLPVARARRRAGRCRRGCRSGRRRSTSPSSRQRSACVAVEVGDVLDRRAEAGRADHRAVAAREAPLGDVVPARVLEVARQAARGGPSRLDAAGPSVAAALRRPHAPRRRASACSASAAPGSSARSSAPRSRADLDEEAVLAVEELGQREVEARLGAAARFPSTRRSRCRRARRS